MRNLAIMGLGPSSATVPDDYETWGLPISKNYSYDRYFECHENWSDIPLLKDVDYETFPVVEFIGEKPFDNAVEFPFRLCVKMFGCYFECSIAYMLAAAILRGYDTILLVGVSGDDGYVSQRPNLEYLLGFAKAKGINIFLDPSSKLLTSEFESGRYGNN